MTVDEAKAALEAIRNERGARKMFLMVRAHDQVIRRIEREYGKRLRAAELALMEAIDGQDQRR